MVHSESEPRFLADGMLGRLARWLRVLGLDTLYEPTLPDADLVALAAGEDRVLLTRDRHLVTHLRPDKALLLAAEAPLDQLREVVEACEVPRPRELFTRCLLCNAPLRPAAPEEVETAVPEHSRASGGPFLRCPRCGRLYWEGSHVRHMRATLAGVLPRLF